MTGDLFHLAGTVVEGTYRIDGFVGEGSYGVVYRGLDLVHMKPIAFKVLRLPPQLSAVTRERLLAKFEEEADALIELSSGIRPSRG
jgi:serine/threonine protein kinase